MGSLRAVSMTTGTTLVSRMVRHRLIPSIPGSMTSSSTTSNTPERNEARPARAVRGNLDGEAVALQGEPGHLTDGGVVLDKEHAGSIHLRESVREAAAGRRAACNLLQDRCGVYARMRRAGGIPQRLRGDLGADPLAEHLDLDPRAAPLLRRRAGRQTRSRRSTAKP